MSERDIKKLEMRCLRAIHEFIRTSCEIRCLVNFVRIGQFVNSIQQTRHKSIRKYDVLDADKSLEKMRKEVADDEHTRET